MSNITKSANPSLLSYFSGKALKAIRTLASNVIDAVELRIEAIKSEESLKAKLKAHLKQVYFEDNTDATSPEDVRHTYDADGLQINFVNSYRIDSWNYNRLLTLIGSAHPLKNEIKVNKQLKVDVSRLSEEEIAKLSSTIASFANLGKFDIERSEEATVTDKFHNLRHVYLTVEDNMKLDSVLPVQVQVAVIDEKRES